MALAFVMAGCATSDTSREAVTHTRPDGEVVTCLRPSDELLGSDLATALSAGFPGIVQILLSSEAAGKKVDDIAEDVPTADLVRVLDYRLCLEYGDGVLPGATWEQWRTAVRPALERRASAAVADSAAADTARLP